ncbi:hypothetical protein HID58_095728 [Brassica napus]|uniref:Calcineurin B-like protein n=1 Tax=Brassica napus TaxID=3708 RepID=A0ABQ7X2I4_BRANA|nr:hypothetical protein HID58_095728 [Brassica napus]
MGCVCSKHLEEQEQGMKTSRFCFSNLFDAEVEVLHELFTKLTSCVRRFSVILTKDTKRRSLSTERMFGLFDMRNDEAIDFGEFVHSLNISIRTPPKEIKPYLHFGYMILVRLDLLNRKRTDANESIIDSIVSKTFEEADRKKDGKIDLEEWENFVARHPLILKNMTIPFLKDLPRTFHAFSNKSQILTGDDGLSMAKE